MVDQRKCTTCTKGAETPETRAIRVVLDRLADHSPTEDEAQAVITHIRNPATQRGTTIARIERLYEERLDQRSLLQDWLARFTGVLESQDRARIERERGELSRALDQIEARGFD